jgi:hypothetical protein
MIRWGTYGSGSLTLGMGIIRGLLLMVEFGMEVMKSTECCVAVRGASTRGTPVPPTATGSPRAGGSTSTAFGWCRPWRGLVALCPFELCSFFFLKGNRFKMWGAAEPAIFFFGYNNFIIMVILGEGIKYNSLFNKRIKNGN